MPSQAPHRGGLAAMTYRELMRATPATTRARTGTALASLLPAGEVVEVRTFGALLSNWAADRSLGFLARQGLVGGLATPALEMRSLTHVILTDRRALAIADPSLELIWSATRSSVRADRFVYGAEGVLRLRDQDSGIVVLRLHAYGGDAGAAGVLAEALGAPPSRERGIRLSNIDLFGS
jgi:hypothetical protein